MPKTTLFNYFIKSPSTKNKSDGGTPGKPKPTSSTASPLASELKKKKPFSPKDRQADGKENAATENVNNPKKLKMSEKESEMFEEKTNPVEEMEMNCLAMREKKSPGSKSNRLRARTGKKYRRIIESDEDNNISNDEDDNYKPDGEGSQENESTSSESGVSEKMSSAEEEQEEDDIPVKTGTKRKRPSTSAPKLTQTKSKLLSFQAVDSQSTSSSDGRNVYLHETLDFLFPENVKDIEGRKPNNPDYDKSTLKIPQSFLAKLTPAMHQWWTIKSKNYDVILFFKVGKFYELYHMDAVVGVKELGLTFMKGNFAHSGFPEVAFGRYSSALVQKGYTIARVEQTETPEQNAQRIKGRSLPKYEKTLRREVCRITTKGTQMLNAWEEARIHNHEHNFLLAVCERSVDHLDGKQNICREFGVCFLDTTVGTLYLGQFHDDRYCSRFRTMIAHYYPCQILFEKGKVSAELHKILHTGLASVLQNGLVSGSQFWDATKTLKTLSNEKYFVKDEEEMWPQLLTSMKSDTSALGFLAKTEFELAISSLGACVYYLKRCLIDFEIISMRQFQMYECKEEQTTVKERKEEFPSLNQVMVLDSATLSNLEIIQNSKGSSEGSLLEKLNHCKTPFGKRLLRQWVCSPPCHPSIINARLDAIDDLIVNKEVASSLIATLTKMPDLERMLAQIHSMSKGMRQNDHPDSRAILYEEKIYSKRKISDFMCVLEHYEITFNCLKKLQDQIGSFKSDLLRRILGLSREGGDGAFPDLENILSHWKKAFNHKKAKETGKIIPNAGTNPEYDHAICDLESINNRAEKYLNEQKKIFSCAKIIYKGTGNKRFQLEIPADVATRKVSHDYEISGQRKGFKSFRTEATKELLKEIEAAEAHRDAAQADSMAIIFREFSKDFEMWKIAIQFLGQTDVLISLSEFSKGADGEMCRPEVLMPDEYSQPLLDVREARHPCVTKTIFSDAFIPNDTLLGCDRDGGEIPECYSSLCMLLTGPNMGGKSTLMRQVGLLVVLAQLGCRVPAQSCRFTSCDRIFTRLGAFDRIMAGESTFFVELSETSSILKHATKDSLVLLDELGRGTSTYDGTAIASAVLEDIAQNVRCRTIFSTHYRTLVDDVAPHCNIQLGHMACMVEDGDDTVEEVLTFLYKLASGACPKSYGFHAASLASVSDDVVKLARVKAAELESNKKNLATFRELFYKDVAEIGSV
ncbi:unnamed protein product [Clavelina lepadiformis]|uniref:DNA mismatch repair protein n=1 Tax=Clavelina lepadiformis TaxID=159417 RepID=A0ABP0GM33_CLALP